MNMQKVTLLTKSIIMLIVATNLTSGQLSEDQIKNEKNYDFDKSNYAYHINPEVNELLEEVTGLDFFVKDNKVLVKNVEDLKDYTEYSSNEFHKTLGENYYDNKRDHLKKLRESPSWRDNEGFQYNSAFFIKDNIYLNLGYSNYFDEFALMNVRVANFEASKYGIEEKDKQTQIIYNQRRDLLRIDKKEGHYGMSYKIDQLKNDSSYFMLEIINVMSYETNKILTFFSSFLVFVLFYFINNLLSLKKLSRGGSFKPLSFNFSDRKKRKKNKALYLKKEKELRKKKKESSVIERKIVVEEEEEENVTIKND